MPGDQGRVFQALKGKHFQLDILYPVQLSSGHPGRTKGALRCLWTQCSPSQVSQEEGTPGFPRKRRRRRRKDTAERGSSKSNRPVRGATLGRSPQGKIPRGRGVGGGQGIVTRTKAPPERRDPALIWPLEGGRESGQELRGLLESLTGGGNPTSQKVNQNRNQDLRALASPTPPEHRARGADRGKQHPGAVPDAGAPGQRHENRDARDTPWRQGGGWAQPQSRPIPRKAERRPRNPQ